MFLSMALILIACASSAQEESMGHLAERVFSLASVQTGYMDSLLSEAGEAGR